MFVLPGETVPLEKLLPGPTGGGWVVRLLPTHGSWGRRPRRLTQTSRVNVDPELGSGWLIIVDNSDRKYI
eukprot:522755-Prorocentrum_minimum.AAC.2